MSLSSLCFTSDDILRNDPTSLQMVFTIHDCITIDLGQYHPLIRTWGGVAQGARGGGAEIGDGPGGHDHYQARWHASPRLARSPAYDGSRIQKNGREDTTVFLGCCEVNRRRRVLEDTTIF